MQTLKDMSQVEYDKLKSLCARAIGVFSSQVLITEVKPLGESVFVITILYKSFYRYRMNYDGDNFSEITRLI